MNIVSRIKILVSCHAASYVPETDIIKSIRCGAAGRDLINGMSYYDNTGDNISAQNDKYCELTAQYWAWKNLDIDYYGFFHYRRYLSFSENKYKSDNNNNVFFDIAGDKFINDFSLNDKSINDFIGDYDIVAPIPVCFKKDPRLIGKKKDNYTHYKISRDHDITDLDFALDYIKNNLPEYMNAAEEYMRSGAGYFLNMYILKKNIFFSYCEWLFPILAAVNAHKDYTRCNSYEYRAVGLIAERLFGVYVTYLKKNRPDIKIKHTQQAYILDSGEPYPMPAFPENNVVVALGCSEYYVPFAGNVISSVAANSSSGYGYDIFVITHGMSESNKTLLKAAAGDAENISVRFIGGERYLAGGTLFEKHHINAETYLRFAMLDFLRNYDKAVYLDCDIVVNRDIAQLYDTDISGYYFGAVHDTVQAVWCSSRKSEQLAYNKKVLGITDDFDYYNAGVMIMNLSRMRKDFSTEDLLKLARSRKWRWQDQDILNYIAKNGKILRLNPSWNVQVNARNLFSGEPQHSLPKTALDEYIKGRADPYIIHYAGRQIPCFYVEADLAEYFWKYARQSPFYEKILFLMAKNASGKRKMHNKKSLLFRVANKLFPKNSRRRLFAKRIYYFFFRNAYK